jgi:hypothetical protein
MSVAETESARESVTLQGSGWLTPKDEASLPAVVDLGSYLSSCRDCSSCEKVSSYGACSGLRIAPQRRLL